MVLILSSSWQEFTHIFLSIIDNSLTFPPQLEGFEGSAFDLQISHFSVVFEVKYYKLVVLSVTKIPGLV